MRERVRERESKRESERERNSERERESKRERRRLRVQKRECENNRMTLFYFLFKQNHAFLPIL